MVFSLMISVGLYQIQDFHYLIFYYYCYFYYYYLNRLSQICLFFFINLYLFLIHEIYFYLYLKIFKNFHDPHHHQIYSIHNPISNL